MVQEDTKVGFNSKAAIEMPVETFEGEDVDQEFKSEQDECEHMEEDEDGLYTDREEKDEEDMSSYEEEYMEEIEALIRKQWGLERKMQRGTEAGTEKELY